jgi:hypothetical protein
MFSIVLMFLSLFLIHDVIIVRCLRAENIQTYLEMTATHPELGPAAFLLTAASARSHWMSTVVASVSSSAASTCAVRSILDDRIPRFVSQVKDRIASSFTPELQCQLLSLPRGTLRHCLPLATHRNTPDFFFAAPEASVGHVVSDLASNLSIYTTGVQRSRLHALVLASGGGKTKCFYSIAAECKRLSYSVVPVLIHCAFSSASKDLPTPFARCTAILDNIKDQLLLARRTLLDASAFHSVREGFTSFLQMNRLLLSYALLAYVTVAVDVWIHLEKICSGDTDRLEMYLRIQQFAAEGEDYWTTVADVFCHLLKEDVSSCVDGLPEQQLAEKADKRFMTIEGQLKSSGTELILFFDEVSAFSGKCEGLFLHDDDCVEFKSGERAGSRAVKELFDNVDGQKADMFYGVRQWMLRNHKKILQVVLDTRLSQWAMQQLFVASSPLRDSVIELSPFYSVTVNDMVAVLQYYFDVPVEVWSNSAVRNCLAMHEGRPIFFFEDFIPQLVHELRHVSTAMDSGQWVSAVCNSSRAAQTRSMDRLLKAFKVTDRTPWQQPVASWSPYLKAVARAYFCTMMDNGRIHFDSSNMDELVATGILFVGQSTAKVYDLNREPLTLSALQKLPRVVLQRYLDGSLSQVGTWWPDVAGRIAEFGLAAKLLIQFERAASVSSFELGYLKQRKENTLMTLSEYTHPEFSAYMLHPKGAIVMEDTKDCAAGLKEVFDHLENELIVLPPASMGPDLLVLARKDACGDRMLMSIQLKQQKGNPVASGFCSLNPILWFTQNRLSLWKKNTEFGNKAVRDFFLQQQHLRPKFLCIYSSNRQLRAGPIAKLRLHKTTDYIFSLMSFGDCVKAYGSISKTTLVAISGWKAPWNYAELQVTDTTSSEPATESEDDADTSGSVAKAPRYEQAQDIATARQFQASASSTSSSPGVK